MRVVGDSEGCGPEVSWGGLCSHVEGWRLSGVEGGEALRGLPSLRGVLWHETWSVTGARTVVGCSEDFLSRCHLHTGQQPFPHIATTSPAVLSQDTLVLILTCLISKGTLVFLAHPSVH